MPKLPLVLIAVMFVVGAVFYPRLPDVIPTHWGLSGVPDSWSARSFWSVFMTPLIATGMCGLFLVMPYFDPKRANILRSKRAYTITLDGLTALLTAVFVSTMAAAFNRSFPVDRVILLSVGLLFILIGNHLATLKQNWTMGVRFSWTLADEVVWRRANRLGGYCFVGAGALSLIGVLLPAPWNFLVMIVPVLGMLPVLWVYSYLEYRKRHPEEMSAPPRPE